MRRGSLWRILWWGCLVLLLLVFGVGTAWAPPDEAVPVVAGAVMEGTEVEGADWAEGADEEAASSDGAFAEASDDGPELAGLADGETAGVAELDTEAVPAVAGVASEEGVLTATGEPRPQLAIVIDDWGYAWSAADSILAFPAPLTVAVIPGLPFSQAHAERAREVGFDVLVHLPMEPLSGAHLVEPWGVTVDLPEEEIVAVVQRGFQEIPGAVGLNNHMGSKATQDARVMKVVLEAVAAEGAFFLDSATTSASVVGEVAASLGHAHLANRIFIDSEEDVDSVVRRLRQAADLAERHGRAIAIGHVKVPTAEALYIVLPELLERGIELVPISLFAPAVERVAAYGVAASGSVAVVEDGGIGTVGESEVGAIASIEGVAAECNPFDGGRAKRVRRTDSAWWKTVSSRLGVRAGGGSTEGDCADHGGAQEGRALCDAPRSDGDGEDLHHGEGDRTAATADLGDGAQQDVGGAAVQ